MHIQHLCKIGNLHFGERFVAQDAGIGAEQIDTAPLRGRAIHHRLDLLEVRDIGAVGHRYATRFSDFLDHRFRRVERSAGAVARAAEIIDDDLCAAARQSQRMRASKTIARAGNDGDASVKPDCHCIKFPDFGFRHARPCAGHPRLLGWCIKQDVDGRDKPGHDERC